MHPLLTILFLDAHMAELEGRRRTARPVDRFPGLPRIRGREGRV